MTFPSDATVEWLRLHAAGVLTPNEVRKSVQLNSEYKYNNITTTGTQWYQPIYAGGGYNSPMFEITWQPPVFADEEPGDEAPIVWLHRRVDELVDSALEAA